MPILILAEGLTVLSSRLLGVHPALQVLSAVAIAFMALALVGLAAGMGATHPRFAAENLTQVAGSYGGVSFMVLAVLYMLVTVGLLAWPASTYLWHEIRNLPISPSRQVWMVALLAAAVVLSLLTFWLPMRRGVPALDALG